MLSRPTRAEAQSDLDHGQVVIVTARWILIAAGLFLAIVYPPANVAELRLQIAVILVLAVANFFLHAQLLKGRPITRDTAYAASGIDLAVISILLLSQSGHDPYLYVLYFPALLGLSVAFEPAVTAIYAGATAAFYGLFAIATAPSLAVAMPIVTTRMLMLIAVAFCGAVYWRVEHDRRARIERSVS